jgi:hypothetical protein
MSEVHLIFILFFSFFIFMVSSDFGTKERHDKKPIEEAQG